MVAYLWAWGWESDGRRRRWRIKMGMDSRVTGFGNKEV